MTQISIHAAQEGCDEPPYCKMCGQKLFQSTQPKRAATPHTGWNSCNSDYFNPRSPRGLRRFCNISKTSLLDFNPRSPRGLRLKTSFGSMSLFNYFNPRSPRGLRHGLIFASTAANANFNPRSPRGLRQYKNKL